MLPTKFRFIWPSVFREEDFKQISQSEKRIACGGHVCKWIGKNIQSLETTAHRCFLPSFVSLGQTVSEEKNLKNQPIIKKSRLWQSCLLTDRDEMSNLYR
jgi:hypothetical protein